MADDIVIRLRNPDIGDVSDAMLDAADEIERLRAEVRMLCRRCRMGCHEAHGVVCDECKEARRG